MDSWAPSVDFAAHFLCENVVSGSYCLQRKAPAGGGGETAQSSEMKSKVLLSY